VRYHDDGGHCNGYYKNAAEEVISSLNQSLSTGPISTQWKEMSAVPYYNTATVPYSNPPVIIGGSVKGACTSNITVYNVTNNS